MWLMQTNPPAFAPCFLQSVHGNPQFRGNRTQTQALCFVSLNLHEVHFYGFPPELPPGTLGTLEPSLGAFAQRDPFLLCYR